MNKSKQGLCMLRGIEVVAGQTCDYFDRDAIIRNYPKLACCALCKNYVPKQLIEPPQKKDNPPNPSNYDSHG
jgi:hypothetical protein